MQDCTALVNQLGQCKRELVLVIEIDRIRDEIADDPQQMLISLTETITKALHADAGLLALTKGTSQATWAATIDPDSIIPSIDASALHQIAQAAMSLHTVSTLEPGDVLLSNGVKHLLVAPLTVSGRRLGCLIYLSQKRRFGANDVALLTTAASQADSAVMQAQIWQQLETQKQELEERYRQLDAIYRVDRARDQTIDTNRLVMQVADVLTDTLNVELCMVGLVGEKSDEVVLKAVNDRINVLHKLETRAVQKILDRAVLLDAPTILDVDQAFSSQALKHILAAPLAIEDARLGVFVLANRDHPFSSSDIDLVRAVVSQTDSAIVHARVSQQVQERSQQLEAIYRVDRIRDETSNVQEILSSVANIAIRSVDADLCLMSLVSEENGRNELKFIEDHQGVFAKLDKDAVRQTMLWAASQKKVTTLDQDVPLARWGLRFLIGSPLVVADEPLGALVLARGRRSFTRPERELLHAVVSQTDSAIVYARAMYHLEQRNRELETLYRVDHIRDQDYDFGEMLSAVLNELCNVINAEMGFVMLFDPEGKQLELRASTADDFLATTGHYDLIEEAAYESLRTGKLYAMNELNEWLNSLMCVPLILRDQIIGVFGAANCRGPGGFTTKDKRLLLAITSQIDTAIFESLDKQRIRGMFRRYVGPSVMEQMLTTQEKDFLKVERALLTVLFSDMRGFTSMSERVDVDVLVEMINMHLGAMTRIVMGNNGTLDKFVADEVMAIFGAPLPMRDHALRAIRTALQMQAVQQELVIRWEQRGYCLPPIGIGINTGEMVVGNIGCEQQMDYTVIGDVVNLASRLCDAAAGHQILITDATYTCVADAIHANKLPKIRVKGKEEPVQIYQVVGLK
jgi:class 3 adenylate cyclase/GTP-sensing pleiotropic transcriptional regulator CodY